MWKIIIFFKARSISGADNPSCLRVGFPLVDFLLWLLEEFQIISPLCGTRKCHNQSVGCLFHLSCVEKCGKGKRMAIVVSERAFLVFNV